MHAGKMMDDIHSLFLLYHIVKSNMHKKFTKGFLKTYCAVGLYSIPIIHVLCSSYTLYSVYNVPFYGFYHAGILSAGLGETTHFGAAKSR